MRSRAIHSKKCVFRGERGALDNLLKLLSTRYVSITICSKLSMTPKARTRIWHLLRDGFLIQFHNESE